MSGFNDYNLPPGSFDPKRPRIRLEKPAGYTSESNNTLARVRNTRDFNGRPISRRDLNEILMLTWGE